MFTYTCKYTSDLGSAGTELNEDTDAGYDKQHSQYDLVNHQTERQVDIVLQHI